MVKFIKTYNEYLSIPVALLLFLAMPVIYRRFDATAGSFDIGYLHVIVFGIIAINVASAVSWLMLRLSFPTLYKFWDDEMEAHLLEGSSVYLNAIKYSFLIYFAYFIAFIAIVCLAL